MSDLVPYDNEFEEYLDTIEDFDEATDSGIPRMSIDGPSGQFVDSLSGETFNPLTCIILGMVKQRVLWPLEVADDPAPPLCRAREVKVGGLPGEEFPWAESGFDPNAFVEGDHLDCSSCRLAQWGSRPDGRDTPWCSEQIVMPAMIEVRPDVLAPVLLTFQRSSLGAARKYMQSFARAKIPPFTVWTTITLDTAKRGGVTYAVPTFKKGAPTESDKYRLFGDNFKSAKAYLTREATVVPELEGAEVAGELAKASSRPTPPPVAEMDDDDIPFEDD